MKYPILEFSNTDFDSFVKQWSSFYNYDKMNLYDDNIGKSILEVEDLINLYTWKNGTLLSGFNENGEHQGKFKGLNKNILSKILHINELKKNFDLNVFDKEFGKVSFVWKVFLMHIIQPDFYPIYDQHIHRAYLFLQGDSSFKNVKNTLKEPEKKKFYERTVITIIQYLLF